MEPMEPITQAELAVCYYPEHWPQDKWETDAAAMMENGITRVRIAEFSWSRIEPEDGRFEWDWLDQAVDVLARAGLKITMCTPTATPPKWLVDKMPDMLAVGEDGVVRGFGSRRHYSFSHAGYRAQSKRITTLIAERYGAHPAVHAWQTDNEYGCHDTILSYCEAARDGFRLWLRNKYKTIAPLNDAWGNVFWSMEYNNFEQIELPNLTVTEANPSHALDFRRYSTAAVAAFNKDQVDVIRHYSPERPIAHNYMGDFNQFDHRVVARDLDIASWDSYPLGFLQNLQLTARLDERLHRDCLRVGDPDFQAFHHDLYRGMGRLWVMEQQPGPVNWARTNVIPANGAVRMWSWEAIAHGAEVVSYFRWRQSAFAQEHMHAGLMLRDDTPAPGLAEAKQVAEELQQITLPLNDKAEIALIHDYEADWMSALDGQTADFYYLRLLLDVYRAVRQNGGSLDVIGPKDDLTGYKLIIAPSLMHVSDDLAKRLEAADATILVGPRTGAKTADFQLPENLAPGPLGGLTGFRVTRVDALPKAFPISVQWNGIDGEVSVWHERGDMSGMPKGTTVLGDPLVVSSNKTSYLTGWPDAVLLKAIIKEQMEIAQIEIIDMPEYLRVRRRGDLVCVMNYGPETVTLPDTLRGDIIIGERRIPQAGIVMLRDA